MKIQHSLFDLPGNNRSLNSQFLQSPRRFRAWFAKHAATESELIVGFYKRGSGHASITWPEAVDEACVGWIDGVHTRLPTREPRLAKLIEASLNGQRL